MNHEYTSNHETLQEHQDLIRNFNQYSVDLLVWSNCAAEPNVLTIMQQCLNLLTITTA